MQTIQLVRSQGDQIALVPDKLYLTVGTNVDHNYYTRASIPYRARGWRGRS